MTDQAASTTIEGLISELGQKNGVRRQKARHKLVAMGAAAAPALITAVSSPERWVRWEAAKALTSVSHRDAIGPLIGLLEDPDAGTRWLAAEALAKLDRECVVPLLRAVIEKPKSWQIHEGAHHVFHTLIKAGHDGDLSPVMDALGSPEPEVEGPRAAREALDKRG